MCRPIFSREEETVGEADLSRRKRVTTRLSFFYTGGQFSFLEHRGHDIPSRVYNCIKNFTLMLCSSNHSYEKKKKKDAGFIGPFYPPIVCATREWADPSPLFGSLRRPTEKAVSLHPCPIAFHTATHLESPRNQRAINCQSFIVKNGLSKKKKKHELRGVQIIKQSGYSVQYSSLSRMFLFVCFYSKWLP